MHARALAVRAGSVLAIGLAGIAYLHPSAAGATQPRTAVPSSGYHLAAVDFVSPTTGWVAATFDSGSFAVVRTTEPATAGPSS